MSRSSSPFYLFISTHECPQVGIRVTCGEEIGHGDLGGRPAAMWFVRRFQIQRMHAFPDPVS